MFFKNKLVVLLMLLMFILFSSCTPLLKTTDSKIQKIVVNDSIELEEKIIINMQGHWKGEDLRENYVLETIKQFETRNPNVKVNLQWNADFPNGRKGAIDATVEQFKTGQIVWDIIWLEPFYYQEIANELKDNNWGQNYLVDFETIPGFVDSQHSFILDDSQFRNHMNGLITGPYIEGFYQPFFYNKELTEMMGIEVKEQGMTFDDLLSYFAQVDQYNKEHNTNIPILYDSGDYAGGIGYGQSTWNIFQSLFRSQFSDIEEIKNTQTSQKKLDAMKKALYSLEELSAYNPLIEGWKDLPWFATRNYVLDNKAVFTACGASWMYSHWHGINGLKTMKMVPVEMPVYQEVNHYIGGYNPMFAVAKDSEHKELAITLLMEFSTPNSAEKWIRYAKGPSGIKGSISQAGSTSKTTNQYDIFITYITEKYGGEVFDSKTVDYILGAQYVDLTIPFSKHLGAIMDGEITANQAYDLIIADMNQLDELR